MKITVEVKEQMLELVRRLGIDVDVNSEVDLLLKLMKEDLIQSKENGGDEVIVVLTKKGKRILEE